MDLHTWIHMQMEIALSDMNRYFFHLHHGRDARNDDELMEYYIQFGAGVFAQEHAGELDEKECNRTITTPPKT